jgi:dipeptidyl aminopeptidase/acylaminoacyl peptidase
MPPKKPVSIAARLAKFAACSGVLLLVLFGSSSVLPALSKPVPRENAGTGLVTTPDVIRMTRLGDLGDSWFPDHIAALSPDGTKSILVLRTGNLRRNTNDYSILLWRTSDLFRSATPVRLLTMSSSSNRQAIKNVGWLANNDTIAFIGEHPGELQQFYLYNIHTRTLRQITHSKANVLSYSLSHNGSQIAYVVDEPPKNVFGSRTAHDGFIVSGQLLPDLISNRQGGPRSQHETLFFGKTNSQQGMQILSQVELENGETPVLSPDGSYIAIAAQVHDIPPMWAEYSDTIVHTLIGQHLLRGQRPTLERYEIIDTRSGRSQVLLDSPVYGPRELCWSPDSKSVAISNMLLPLDGSSATERVLRRKTHFSVEIDVKTGTLTKISDADLKLVDWKDTTGALTFAPRMPDAASGSATQIVFRKNGARWEQDAPTSSINSMEIILDEDMNTPPKLYVLDPLSRRRRLLLDLNPQFRRLKFARVEEIEWRGSDGHPVEGGFYYPIGYIPGKRYPLVIQTHGWTSQKFWVDGPFTTAFAAQPLAANGIAVLQMDEDYADMLTPRELPREMASIEGAIDYLDKRGLIDVGRVGIIGFSRTFLHTMYVLTHSKYRFAAASVTDGMDGGYFQYLALSNAIPTAASSSDSIFGGPPLGLTLARWLEMSPSFGIDKVWTPLRIVALSPESLVGNWEWFAGLSRLDRPVELAYIPGGSHILQKPWDRLVSQQGNVDWFTFWLTGNEPTNKSETMRWLLLRGELGSGQPRSVTP